MGQYFIVVNPTKKQYVDPSHFFGQSIKRGGILQGYCGNIIEGLIRDGPRDPKSPFTGLWLGDRIIVAGDDYGEPNPAGLTTATPTQPDRNLNRMAREEFQDLSYHALKWLFDRSESVAKDFAMLANRDDGLLIDAGQIVFRLTCFNLNEALNTQIGADWPRAYKAALSKEGSHHYFASVDPIGVLPQ